MLNVAIVGTGNISHNHIQGYLQFGQRCRIVALVDIYPEKAEEKKARYGLTDARVYASHRQLLEDALPIDIVDVCTRPMSMRRSALMRFMPAAMCCVKNRWPPRWRSVMR